MDTIDSNEDTDGHVANDDQISAQVMSQNENVNEVVSIQEPVVGQVQLVQEAGANIVDGFDQETSTADNERMIAMMKEKMENKLYPIFRRKTRWERGVILRRNAVGQSVKSTPQKRKNPTPENDCVEDNLISKQSRRNTIGSPNNTSRKPPRKRTKSLSVIQGQSLITDMMKGTREQV